MSWLRMCDLWTFKPKEIMQNKRHLFECKDSTSPTGSSLLVKVAATHSGIVNSNGRFYRPDAMQDAAHQWLPPEPGKGFAKPVLVEHDHKSDVLGRVRTARYIDESYKWSNDFPTIKDSVFYKVGDKKVDLFKSVDWIVDNLMGLQDYSGLGYIELGLNVTNPEAIGKVLRDEYLTVSVGFKTDSAICSICHQDWAKDDKCEHRPGVRDEESGKTMFHITGDFVYEEVSFVNFPADPFAGKISKDALKDSLNRKFFMGMSHDKQQAFVAAAGMSMSDAALDYDIQLVEDTVATIHDLSKSEGQVAFEAEVKSDALNASRSVELKQNLQDWKPEAEAEKTKKRSLMSTLNAKIKKNGWVGAEAASAAATDEENEIQAAISTDTNKDCGCGSKKNESACNCETDWSKETLTTDETEFFADEEGLYAEMVIELDAALAAGELKDEQVKDSKLSTEARKKLGSSTFCGPNRSFPVPDCAHVTAARRLIGRAKVGDSTKSKILACVSRKASSLGCGGAKKDEAPQVATKTDTIQVSDEFKALLDEKSGNCAAEVLNTYDTLNKHYKGSDDDMKGRMRHLHYRMGESWDNASSLEWAKQHVKAHAKDEVLVSTKDLADKEEAINSLTDEVAALKAAAGNADAAKATAAEMLKGVKKSLATQIVIYKTLSGAAEYKDLTTEQRSAKVEELSKRHVTSLKDAVADIMTELKWVEPTTTQPADKAKELSQPVADNAQVDQSVAARETAVIPPAETESDKLKKLEDAKAAIRERLRSMGSARERNIYLASLSYDSANPASSQS